ncbi:MAG TPA: carboxypeptidase-like regulatory domain-containing protein [Thermoanaerobaculia bacterium]|nr:carboxypeptidase-like regulatory domain-containing protein [Thermoanaerobaculia bacterium]
MTDSSAFLRELEASVRRRDAFRRRWSRVRIAAMWIGGPLLLMHLFAGGSPVQWGAPVRGRVIEEQTANPLPGVLVVGRWYTRGFNGEHLIYASETLTDARGEYILPGMPPKIRPLLDRYDYRSPEIQVYKPGWGVNTVNELPRGHYTDTWWARAPRIVSYWNGKDIPLPKIDPHLEDEALTMMHDYAMWLGEPKEWPTNSRRLPILWKTLVEGYRRLPPGVEPRSGNPQMQIDYIEKESR